MNWWIIVVRIWVTAGIGWATLKLLSPGVTAPRYSAAVLGLFVVAVLWIADLEHASQIAVLGIKIDQRIKLAENAIRRLENLESSATKTAEHLNGIESSAKETSNQLAALTTEGQAAAEEMRFLALVAQASNDDRKAMDELIEIAKAPDHRFSDRANRFLQNVGIEVRLELAIPWEQGVNPKELGYTEFKQAYDSLPRPYRPSVVTALWESNRMTKKEKLDFLTDVIRQDDNWGAVETRTISKQLPSLRYQPQGRVLQLDF